MSNTTDASDSTSTDPPKYDHGDIAYTLVSTALVWLMIPGVGYFYSGMARSKNALSLIMLSVLSVAVVSFQWWIWGYSLTFSKGGSRFIGNLENAFFNKVGDQPSVGSTTIPDLVFAVYQCMFAAITPALAIGSAAERGRLLPAIIFIFIWSTVVYDPIACWTWSAEGWSFKMGGLDFAGGTPVHISSGFAALAYCLVVGKPLAGSLHAAMACVVTNLSAAVGGLTWMLLDYRLERKLSALGFCSGAVAGLVAITPGSGFVGPSSAVLFGFLGGLACNLAVKVKHWLDFDDALDVFAVHGIGGVVGNLLTGIFAQTKYATLDGPDPRHPDGFGGLDGNWIQLAYQLADSAAGASYSFGVTIIILFVMDKIPYCSLRSDHEAEIIGLDEAELGELAYYHVDRLITVNTRTGETKTVKEETVHQGNDTNVSIM
ncbi:2611_t:CDS:2 [Ambispora gerdemannii]|uniref:2611_t:CDS:1 n=1 Tax=Ambispora gerdemannii TaxID=144530 RepID=A0A9N9FH58_9GLOM|nr:2611_t:CDS:2 [Ambispora gerdemannii]